MTVEELVRRLGEQGLDVTEQAIAYKAERGSLVLHVLRSRSGRATRVDLKGYDNFLSEPEFKKATEISVVRELSREEAREQHLGKVSRQIWFGADHDREGQLACSVFDACIKRMMDGREAGQDESPPSISVTIRLSRDLVETLDRERRALERELRGIEVTRESAIRFLLHEALEARAKR